MTQLSVPTRSTNPARFEVYTKPLGNEAAEGGIVESTIGGDAGWQYEPRLAFIRSNYRSLPGSSNAVLRVVPTGGVIEPFEETLALGQIDLQVRVVLFPRFAGTSFGPDTTGTEANGLLVFDGVIQRNAFNARGAENRPGQPARPEDEGGSVIAVDAPSMDNHRPEHLVTGRWVNDHRSGGTTPVHVDGLSVASVFNANGKPNRGPTFAVEAESGELTNVNAALFTADGDELAGYWTVKEALGHLIVCWLYGIKDTFGGDAQGALARSATLDKQTYDAIFGPTPDDPQFSGLDAILPEVNVHALGVYNAIERICRFAGFRCSNLPALGRAAEEGAVYDRLHLLRVWRAGSGRENELRLTARDQVNPAAKADEEMADNNVTMLSGIRDAANLVNHVSVAGRTLVEVTVPLKPMWPPDEVDNLGGETISSRQQSQPTGQTGDTYYRRHVANGADFNDYAHVGRRWGIDETGVYYNNSSLGYVTGNYAHQQGGFDWLSELAIDGTDAISLARVANGVTDPVRQLRRPHRPLPLSRPETLFRGQAFLLEVSEDSGTTWSELPQSAARLLTDGTFGVMLTAANLAMVNRKTFGAASEHAVAVPAESWWALFNSGVLRFRLTCLVELDAAARYDIPRDAESASLYPRAQRIDTGYTEVWQSPDSSLGNDAWTRLDDGGLVASSVGADRTVNLRDVAQRAHDELGQVRWSVTIEDRLRLDPSQFQIGDRMTGIAGRDIDFDSASPGSAEPSYPSITSLTLVGLPEDSQRLVADIGSEAMRRGA
ncbi:MAG: hypothetical protein AAGI37_06935 [Planctomycetota bacterium]